MVNVGCFACCSLEATVAVADRGSGGDAEVPTVPTIEASCTTMIQRKSLLLPLAQKALLFEAVLAEADAVVVVSTLRAGVRKEERNEVLPRPYFK